MNDLLEIKDYFPIDKEYVKQKFDEIFNVPNDQWDLLSIDYFIDTINDPNLPNTLRLAKLNLLPNLIIRILDNKESIPC